MTDSAADTEGVTDGARPWWRRALTLGLILLLAAGAVWAGYRWLTHWRFRISVDNAYVQAEITPISALVAGRVVAVLVDDAETVEAGDIIAIIEDEAFQAQVAEAEADLAERRAALHSARLRHRRQRAVIAEAAAAVQAADAALALADQELDRARSLQARAVGTMQRLDEAEAERLRQSAETVRARARHDIALGDLAILANEIARLSAEVEARQATLRQHRRTLTEATIRAPIAGVVGNRQVRVGQYVRPGTLLMVVVPLSDIWVEANVKETVLADLEPGMPARIVVDGFAGVPLIGEIDGLAPATGAEFSILPPQNATGNFTRIVQLVPVTIRLPTAHPLAGVLRPGMSAVVTVDRRDSAGSAGSAQAAP